MRREEEDWSCGVPQRRFPPPWSVDEADSKLDRRSFIVRDANRQALAYVYFEEEPGRRAAARLLTRETRPGASPPNITQTFLAPNL
jgi:hypothetical protein